MKNGLKKPLLVSGFIFIILLKTNCVQNRTPRHLEKS